MKNPKISELYPNEIFLLAMQGNENAFRRFRVTHWLEILKFVRMFVGDGDHVTQITSNAFSLLWARRNDQENIEKARLFLFIAAKNASINYNRQKRSGAESSDTEH